MPRFTYTILSRAVPGREEEFVGWYRDQHIADVCRMPGVIGGQLFASMIWKPHRNGR